MTDDRDENPFAAPSAARPVADEPPLTDLQLRQLLELRNYRDRDFPARRNAGFVYAFYAAVTLLPTAAAVWSMDTLPEVARFGLAGFAVGVVLTCLAFGAYEHRAGQEGWRLYRRFLDWNRIDEALQRGSTPSREAPSHNDRTQRR